MVEMSSLNGDDVNAGEEKISHADEIAKIKKYLKPGEQVLLIARQSRVLPGGTMINPNTIFATDRRLLIRNPRNLGLRSNLHEIWYSAITSVNIENGMLSSEVVITGPGVTEDLGDLFHLNANGLPGIPAIPKEEATKLVNIINDGIERVRGGYGASARSTTPYDELKKLKELLDLGIINQSEFDAKKKELLERY